MRIRNARLKFKLLLVALFLAFLLTLVVRNRYERVLDPDTELELQAPNNMDYFMNDKISLEIDKDDYIHFNRENEDYIFNQDLTALKRELDSDLDYLHSQQTEFKRLRSRMSSQDLFKYKETIGKH
jgi:hypothetical protein